MKGARYKRRGWYGESRRHYLAAKGIKTAKTKQKRYYYTPTYAVGDMSLIAADGVGTAGAAVVPFIPALVAVGGIYLGARGIKRKSEGKSFFVRKHTVRIEGKNGQVITDELSDKELDALDKEVRKKNSLFERYGVLKTTEVENEPEEENVQTPEVKAESVDVKEDEVVDELISLEQFGYDETLKESRKNSPELLAMRISEMQESLKKDKGLSDRQKKLGKGALKALKENQVKAEAKQKKRFFKVKDEDIPISIEKPEDGTIYPVSPKEVKDIVKSQDPEHIKGLKGIEFSNPKGEQKGAWAQYVRSRKAIKVFSQPYYSDKIDGERPENVNSHMKSYVIPHEIGHHRALHIHKITDRNIKMAEARADAHVAGMSPTDRDVKMLIK